MPQTLKIATCCYCGTRAALVLDKTRHELTCGSCGAPLHEMKAMPRAAVPRPKPAVKQAPKHYKKTKKRDDDDDRRKRYKPVKYSRKPRRRWLRDMVEEVWDIVEDVFD